MKEFVLNDEDVQVLKTCLLGFVRRVAFQGAESSGESYVMAEIVKLLLGTELRFTEAETEEPQESENSGKSGCCEGCCRAGFAGDG